ncbi:MAG: hypothetical protein KGH62_01265, partial [Candidatus Micrarchaeota archaeon]|nr:hypothetical protein [Candidatus Micrarchaeota archaeon]
ILVTEGISEGEEGTVIMVAEVGEEAEEIMDLEGLNSTLETIGAAIDSKFRTRNCFSHFGVSLV